MATRANAVPPSRLSKILEQLSSGHKPYLNGVKSLKLKYAFRNDHWGARCVYFWVLAVARVN